MGANVPFLGAERKYYFIKGYRQVLECSLFLTIHERQEHRSWLEIGKRLLEPKSKYKELDGIKAWDYLEKARGMFEEMDLQWDLDELEKLKIQMGT